MNYRQFVKENFHKLPASMAAKDKMKKIGQMWRASGHSSSGASKTTKGAGILSGLLDGIGLGMKPKKSMKSKAKKVVKGKPTKAKGSGILSGLLDSVGLGMEQVPTGGMVVGGAGKRMRKRKGGAVAGGDVAGGGLMDFFNRHGGAVAGGDVAGGGIFSGLLDTIGLGVPDKVKVKHLKKMFVLQNKLQTKGKLTPTEHKRLKVYHHLHGGGFFDSLFSGIKKGVSGVANFAANNLGNIIKAVPEIVKHVPMVGQVLSNVGLDKALPMAAMLL
jgi:hypothetical protein